MRTTNLPAAWKLFMVGAVFVSSPASAGLRPDPGLGTNSVPPVEPTVYFSYVENICIMPGPGSYGEIYWLYVHAPDDDDIVGVHLVLTMDAQNPVTPIVVPSSGVSLDYLNVGLSDYTLEVSWTPRELHHEPVLQFIYLAEPIWEGFQTPGQVEFEHLGGALEPGTGSQTFGGCCVDCLYCSVYFEAESVVQVPVGQTSEVCFAWYWSCHSPGGNYIDVADTEGWVALHEPAAGAGNGNCGACVIPLNPGTVTVMVPEGVPYGTMSTMSIVSRETGYAKTVMLEAVEPTPVANTTWGAIKAQYRDGE